MTSDNIVALKPYQLAALLVIFMTVFAAPLTIAFNIGAIVSAFEATRTEAGLVMTAEGVAVSFASIIGSRLISKYYLKTLLVAGVLLVIAGNALTVMATDIPMMVMCRALAGLGIGTVISSIMATAARTPKPEMTFGWVNASAGAFISLLALAVPFAIIRGGLDGAYGLYTALAIVGLILIAVIPNNKAPTISSPAKASGDKKPAGRFKANAGWIALLGLGIFFFGQAGIAAFVERIGADVGIPLAKIGTIFFFAGLLTIVGPICAGIVGARFGSTKPLVLVGVFICLAVIGIAISGEKIGFYIGVPMIMIMPAIMLPSFLGGLAVVDPTGRLAGAHPAFATMGGAMGPVIAGTISDVGGFATLGWFIVAVLIIGMTLMAAATFKADSLRSASLQPAE